MHVILSNTFKKLAELEEIVMLYMHCIKESSCETVNENIL